MFTFLTKILVASFLIYHCCGSDFQSDERFSDVNISDSFEQIEIPPQPLTITTTTTTSASQIRRVGNKNKIHVGIQSRGNSGLYNSNPKYRYSDYTTGPVSLRIQQLPSFSDSQSNRNVPAPAVDVFSFEQGNGITKISRNDIDSVWGNNPPPPDRVAQMARYIVNVSNWTSIASVSTREPTVGFPFGNIVSLSDGPPGKSTGVPYMYVTGLDLTVQDLKKDPRASLTMSLAQTDYCLHQDYDPEDPRCGRVILTGRVIKLENGTAEANFARQAVFSRHPVMSSWPLDHGFFFAKLDIFNVLVLDYFGGAKTVSPKDYFKAKAVA